MLYFCARADRVLIWCCLETDGVTNLGPHFTGRRTDPDIAHRGAHRGHGLGARARDELRLPDKGRKRDGGGGLLAAVPGFDGQRRPERSDRAKA